MKGKRRSGSIGEEMGSWPNRRSWGRCEMKKEKDFLFRNFDSRSLREIQWGFKMNLL
jgi:hypothetical protein